jgi:hypothetical protein
MGLFDRLFGARARDEQAPRVEQAVLVYLDGTGLPDPSTGRATSQRSQTNSLKSSSVINWVSSMETRSGQQVPRCSCMGRTPSVSSRRLKPRFGRIRFARTRVWSFDEAVLVATSARSRCDAVELELED